MRGHDQIIKFRQAGYRPETVFIFDFPAKVNGPQWREDFRHMEVCTHGDAIGSLDMRFVVGLPVTVLGDEANRVRLIAAECKKAGADRVVAQCGDRFAIWTKESNKWNS